MAQSPQFYIVEASALPEVFLKVVEAKRLLTTGEASTVNEAARMTNISRSAFYKYRDAIMPFQSLNTARIVTFQMMLHDAPGVLSGILSTFAEYETNLQTINSIAPVNGTVLLTITADTSGMQVSLEKMLEILRGTRGVIKAEVLAG